MLKQLPVFLGFILLSGFSWAQEIKILTTGRPVSLRGLSVVTNQIIWVSGTAGTVVVSSDGGNSWKWIQVPGYEKSDFRDIEGFNDQEAVIMGITNPAVILRTVDGGMHWKTVYLDSSKSVFLDAMAFSADYGALVGDPEKGKIYFAETRDRGETWNKKPLSGFCQASLSDSTRTGETFFAASGSNISLIQHGDSAIPYFPVFVTGGKKSCLYISHSRYPLLLNQGGETTGANSIAINPVNPNLAFIAGGDFSHDTLRYGNSLRIRFDPFSQEFPLEPPHGYRSCVEYLNNEQLICCGTTGVDISNDGGMNWKLISNTGFHVCLKAKAGNTVFLAGPHGTIAMLKF
jgi:hypothetical protein